MLLADGNTSRVLMPSIDQQLYLYVYVFGTCERVDPQRAERS